MDFGSGDLSTRSICCVLSQLIFSTSFFVDGRRSVRCKCLGSGQNLNALHHHDYRMHLGKGCFQLLLICASILLGRCIQYASFAFAYLISSGLSNGIFRPIPINDFGSGSIRHLRDQCGTIHLETAHGALRPRKRKHESTVGAEGIRLQAAQAVSLRNSRATLTSLSMEESEGLHRNLVQGTLFFGGMAVIAHLLAYIYSPWLK